MDITFEDITTEVNFWLDKKGWIVDINGRDFRVEDVDQSTPTSLVVVPSSGEEGDEGPGEMIEFDDILTIHIY